MPVKNPWFVIAPLLTTIVFIVVLILPWMQRVDLEDRRLTFLCTINAAIWCVVLWWTMHHLLFKAAPLFVRPPEIPAAKPSDSPLVSFAILYPTCDDFDWSACQSCVQQNYPSDRLLVVICDDSADENYRRKIDEFQQTYPSVRLSRRGNRRGFKAGNLNEAMAHAVPASVSWVVIVDADQNLPSDYVRSLSAATAKAADYVAYVQGRQKSDHVRFSPSGAATPFQCVLGQEIDVFYSYDLLWREAAGFLPMIGHGTALRRSAWEQVKFPEIVSEDFAMSMELRNRSFVGEFADSVESWESFPESFGAFLVRFRKFAGGTAELYRVCLPRFLLGPATFTEKLDMFMMVAWYALMPLVVVNGYLSAYICHELWQRQVSALHPALPYVFVALFLSNFPVLYSTSPTLWHSIQLWFWSSAVYGACLPVVSTRFLVYLLTGANPRFDRTPKGELSTPIGFGTAAAMIALGVVTLELAIYWSSPFSPVLFGLGLSYLCVPLYTQLHVHNLWGSVARVLVFLPGAAYLYALWEMWSWMGI